MDPSFPSSTDPLLMTPTTSSESQLNSTAAGHHQSHHQMTAKHSTPAFTVSPHDSSSHIHFRIGDGGGGPDNLDVLQELLTNQPSPTIVTPPARDGLHQPPPQRMNSASSMSSAGSSEHVSQCRIIPQVCSDEPKQVLVELYDLKLEDERIIAGSWEESARWIKYEEDVEGVEHHRWGLPHVSFLSFHALLQLRKFIAKGIVLLDLPDVQDFVALTELVAAAIASESHEFGAQNARRLAQILQLRHYHVGGRRMSRISTTASSLFHLLEKGSGAHGIEPPHRSVSAAPLAGGHHNPSAHNVRQVLSAELAGGEQAGASSTPFRPHGRSFANSPPTIAEVDECQQDSANNSIHRANNFLQPRNSSPNVRLTFAERPHEEMDFRNCSRENARPISLVERKFTEWKWRAGVGGGKRSTAEQPNTQNPLDCSPALHKCSTDVNAAAGAYGHWHCDLKKLSDGAELVQVLVGEVPWMKKARFVMLRLAKAVPLPELVDSLYPVRIIFVILGPSIADGSYHELGRSLGTLMANKHFKHIAYGARDRCQLIEGLDSFLDGSVVIPPGEIDSKRLISGHELKKALRRRRKEMSRNKVGASERDVPLAGDRRHNKLEEDGNALHAKQQQCGPSTSSRTAQDQSQQQSTQPNGHLQKEELVNSRKCPSPKEGGEEEECDDKRRRRSPWDGCPLFKGLRADIARRMPLYWSDIRDAANFQCLTSVVFMFFASFVPAISFGGLMGKYTDEHIGTIETLFAQCICGIIWAIFSAQPLLIMSATGPVLIFEASLYTFCDSLHLDFLTVRFYAGLFIFLIAICISALDGARLLVYVTRFTEDIFATLISAIFIAESLHFVWHTFKENPVEDYGFYERVHLNCQPGNGTQLSAAGSPAVLSFAPLPFDIQQLGNGTRNLTAELASQRRLAAALAQLKGGGSQMGHRLAAACGEAEPNTALLTAIILFATFILAFLLKKLRESFYLGKHLRRAIGDFGVLIAITVVALIVHWFIPDPYLQRLDMPDHINFTNPEKRAHGLIVRPKLASGDWHGMLVAFIAALLVFILLFVETEITELLLTRKERGCKKGSGMHWDLVLMGACAFLCSIFGLPWMCAAAVQSLAHCSSLTVMKKTAPGARPEVDHVIEQRVTTLGVSVLIGLIAFGGSYLRLPLASLFGVFLYLGAMNLCGVQLVQRMVLFFIPEKYFPDTPYTQEMSIWRMHLYTWIQLVCLFLVYTVKYFKKTALAFPFVLMLFIFFRQIILPRVFTPAELKAIDGDEHGEGEEGDEEDWTEKDFYESVVAPISV